MTTILVTGIPGLSKQQLVDDAIKLCNDGKVFHVSLGDLIAHEAYRLWKTPKERLPFLEHSRQEILRSYAISEAAYRLKCSGTPHKIIDTPLTMFLGGKTFNVIFGAAQIQQLSEAAGGIDYVVSLIDETEKIQSNLEGTPYPNSPGDILTWIEAEASESDSLFAGAKRNLVLPKKEAKENLAKLITDEQPFICYFGFPITHLKEKPGDNREIQEEKRKHNALIESFIQEMGKYVVNIVPLKLSDSRFDNPKDRDATVFRDLGMFIKNSDAMVAFFPVDCYSTGVFSEMKQCSDEGKPAILIHPNNSNGKEVFGVKIFLPYDTAGQFFDAIRICYDSKFNGKPEAILRRLSLPTGSKYAHLYR